MVELLLIGDIHGDFHTLRDIVDKAPKDVPIIQVGDFGYWPSQEKRWLETGIDREIYFIEGNHDYLPSLVNLTQPTKVWNNLIYLPRGTILPFGNKKIGVCGGANSVDYKFRRNRGDWFEQEEQVKQKDVDLFIGKKVDLIITHCAPAILVDSVPDILPRNRLLQQFSLSEDWVDNSTIYVERLWKMLGCPPLFCGHYHINLQWQNIRILNINEACLTTL